MNRIRFSHHYIKLQGQGSEAVLLAIIPYRIDGNTPEALLRYDTRYPDMRSGGSSYYELKPGDYVLLLFLGNAGPFTTIRPLNGRYGNKLEYYSTRIGEEFRIVIEEDR